MQDSNTKPLQLSSRFCAAPGKPMRWRMIDEIGNWGYERDDIDLGFANKSDCDRAIEALRDAGIVTEDQLEALPDEKLRDITLSRIPW